MAGVDDSFTKSLLHFDGADGGTVFTDESGKTWTAIGTAQLDTAQKKFGSASGLFGGTPYIYTADNADFNVAAGDFTMDFWLYRSGTADANLAGQGSAGATTRSFYVDCTTNAPRALIFYGTAFKVATSAATVALNTWTHIAQIRNGNDMSIYVAGVRQGSVDVTGVTVNDSAEALGIACLGNYAGAAAFVGQIDEFRFSKGTARWTANFTPPTAPYAPPVTSFPQVIIFGG